MLEFPEATTLSSQINIYLKNKMIKNAVVMQSPHKLVWTFQDNQKYPQMLINQTILSSESFGGIVEIKLSNNVKLAFSDGFNLRYITSEKDFPKKNINFYLNLLIVHILLHTFKCMED